MGLRFIKLPKNLTAAERINDHRTIEKSLSRHLQSKHSFVFFGAVVVVLGAVHVISFFIHAIFGVEHTSSPLTWEQTVH